MDIQQIIKDMREPKVRDIRAVSHITSDTDKELKLLSNLTGLSDSELDDMSIKDYNLLQEKLKSFL